MTKLWRSLCAGALAFATVATAAIPVSEMPQAAAPVLNVVPDAQLVQFRDDDWRRLRQRRIDRRLNQVERQLDRREARRYSREFERRNNGYYYRGYRGYSYARPGYRYYNGYYFPGAAFIAGAIITGAIVNSARPSGSSHVDWCFNRYRSYRASDNTFQPNSGPRRQCNSPFD